MTKLSWGVRLGQSGRSTPARTARSRFIIGRGGSLHISTVSPTPAAASPERLRTFRRSLLVWILAVATALYTILLAFGPNHFSEAPHLIGDLPRQTSATQTIIEESGISLDFEDVVSGGSSSLQDKPPPVDSSLVKVHYLPEPAEEIPTHIKKQKAQQHEESETGVEPATEPVSIASFSELSVFGNSTSPSDFQRYTPNAPSCTEPLDTADVSYTLVSQVSWDRLWMVGYHCERWGDNPISMAVLSDRSSDHIKARLIREGCYEPGLTVQVVSKSKYDPTGKEYPVNILRNMAISAVKTSHIVYVDIDFWPSADLHKILSNNETKERLAKDAKLATIIPAFQMFWRCTEDCHEENIAVMPEDKDSLINLMMKRRASTFDQTNIGGHGSTKYSTWWDQSPATFVDLPCINSNRYEPYLTFRYCSELPPFQEGFTGYGKNKMTWVMQLRRTGYLFTQLGGVFLTHYPHQDSKARREWNKKPDQVESNDMHDADDKDLDLMKFKRARIDAFFLDFKEWMDGTVEDDSRTQMCIDSLNDDEKVWTPKKTRQTTAAAVTSEGENSQPSDP